MIQKNEHCIYCGIGIESKRASKKFCTDQHRLYYHREVKRGTFTAPILQKKVVVIQDLNVQNKEIKPITAPKQHSNLNINTADKPEKLKGESAIEYKIRMVELESKKIN
jgi:predicted nucleic acid-binding Zn ribbon protein